MIASTKTHGDNFTFFTSGFQKLHTQPSIARRHNDQAHPRAEVCGEETALQSVGCSALLRRCRHEEKPDKGPAANLATEANDERSNCTAAIKVLCKELKATALASTEGYKGLWDCATTLKDAYRDGRRNIVLCRSRSSLQSTLEAIIPQL